MMKLGKSRAMSGVPLFFPRPPAMAPFPCKLFIWFGFEIFWIGVTSYLISG